MKQTLIAILLFLCLVSNSQETYTIGKTEYFADQYYSTTGYNLVKRSEANKMEFLKSRGFKQIPEGFEIDHIKPLSEGGSDDPRNMQLLTIEQHKRKTARERANRSNSTYPLKQSYVTTSTLNNIDDSTTQTYSRTDSNGRNIYKGNNGGEYYVNSNGNKTYVKSESSTTSTQSNYYSAPTYTTPAATSNREIQTGPRGGTYYINSNGNKTYTKSK
jgi:hypothetical protein